MTSSSIAIIGAGAAGLSAARELQAHGHRVQVFDKGRRVGGRTASRETAFGSFDHGAQFMRLPEQESAPPGACARQWPALDSDEKPAAWIGTPSMNHLAQAWAEGLDVHCSLTVTAVQRAGEQWSLTFAEADEQPVFDAVLITIPVPQALNVLAGHAIAPEARARLEAVHYDACWAVMWTPQDVLPTDPSSLRFEAGQPLAWLAREDLKPGRSGPPRLMLHASAPWTAAHLEDAASDVAESLIAHAAAVLGVSARSAYRHAHRWRYAFVREPIGVPALSLLPRFIYASDACLGSRIECARSAGKAAAVELVAALATR